ncbi:MAG: glycosyl transferase family protein [uncultured bacterium]|nr:MAG: glycosyl transferase family protein [uncultured bacterium]
MRPYLSVLIPAYNEEINIKRGVLDSVYEYLRNKNFSWEVIVLDDGSSDRTSALVEKFAKNHKNFYLRREHHRGKGGTIIAGADVARGEYILFTDMDQSTPMDQFDKMLPKLEKGYDVAIGSRSGRPGQPLIRKIMAYGFVILRTIILRLPYKDTQCGFKVFKRDAAQEIFKRIEIYRKGSTSKAGSVTAGFDLEVLYIARKLGLKVAEVPVEWYEYGQRKEVNPITDSIEGFRGMMMVRINSLKGKYRN